MAIGIFLQDVGISINYCVSASICIISVLSCTVLEDDIDDERLLSKVVKAETQG